MATVVVDGGGEKQRTRFPCLTMVRYMVATVVTGLAVVVVVAVTAVDLRPEDIRLYILQGHIEANTLWSRKETVIYPRGRGGSLRRPCESYHHAAGEEQRCRRHDMDNTIDTYTAAESVDLWVTLSAYNPSGRVDVNCTDITVRVVDMPDAPNNVTGMAEIARVTLDKGFLVRRKSSHTVKSWMGVRDARVLSYIATTYAWRASFPAIVEVNATITSVTVLRETAPESVSKWCLQVSVGVDGLSATADDAAAIACKPSDEFYSAGTATLPQAQAPAPAPAPAMSGI